MKTREKALFITDYTFDKRVDGYKRVYIGHEFCERLMPQVCDLNRAIDYCKNYSNIALTIVTSLMTDKYFKKLANILDIAVTKNINIEVVCNDFGVMQFVSKNYNTCTLVCGRSLFSQSLWPQQELVKTVYSALFRKKMFWRANQKEYQALHFLERLRSFDVKRIDISSISDACTYGYSLSKAGFNLSIYSPYRFLTYTRYCNFASNDKISFRQSVLGCKRECKDRHIVFTRKSIPLKYFMHENVILIEDNFNLNDYNYYIDRIIYYDEIMNS
jgi:hypothetical protein